MRSCGAEAKAEQRKLHMSGLKAAEVTRRLKQIPNSSEKIIVLLIKVV